MFSKDQISSQDAQTIIGPSVKVEGDLSAVGNVIVDGILNGNLKTDKNVIIGDQAVITANIKAQNATIAGKTEGAVKISGHLEIKATANISGDITTKSIAIESGARINGKLQMGESEQQSQGLEKNEQKDKAQ